jgi:hypothetical protein
MRVTGFDLLLVGAGMTASPATEKSFRDASAAVPLVELGSEFSTLEAGEAASALLERIAAQLHRAST